MGFFQLVFGEIKEEEKAILEEKIIQCYQKKGITLEDRTLYQTIKKKAKTRSCFQNREANAHSRRFILHFTTRC